MKRIGVGTEAAEADLSIHQIKPALLEANLSVMIGHFQRV